MVRELMKQVDIKSNGIRDASVAMYGRTDIMEGYWRLLSDCQYDIEEGLRLLKAACDWHDAVRPKMKALIPKVYRDQPGLFSLRQIGFDGDGKPILYHCFAQDHASPGDWTVDGILTHVVHIVENAGRSSRDKGGEERGMTMKLVIDCSGFVAAPFKSYENLTKLHQTLMLLYPNVIDTIAVVNYGREARIVWSGICDILDDSLQQKVKFCPEKELDENLGPLSYDVLNWLQMEIHANSKATLGPVQRNFWLPTKGSSDHDPRGSKTFVTELIDRKSDSDGFENHPGIMYGS
ncbi:uncharacterized protein LOC135810385 [Sycon ciliatum]|uniref:uncharacterized protein LOC135810385 n=1 Tax=Sycon ciliatum TaxID=27933 RepID=UPI0031F709FE